MSVFAAWDDSMHLDVNNAGDECGAGELDREGSVCLHLERLDLEPGFHWIDVGVYEANWTRSYDSVWQSLPFEVARARSTALNQSHSWSIG